MLDAGTNDYVAKPFGINERQHAGRGHGPVRIRVELRSNEEISASPTVFEVQGLGVVLAHREVYFYGDRVHLSKTGIRPAAFVDSLPRAGTNPSADSARGTWT